MVLEPQVVRAVSPRSSFRDVAAEAPLVMRHGAPPSLVCAQAKRFTAGYAALRRAARSVIEQGQAITAFGATTRGVERVNVDALCGCDVGVAEACADLFDVPAGCHQRRVVWSAQETSITTLA